MGVPISHPRVASSRSHTQRESHVFAPHWQKFMSSPLRPDLLGPGGTRSEQETAEGEVHTSHCMFLNSFVVDEPEFVHMAMPIDMEEFCNQSSASGDEVGLTFAAIQDLSFCQRLFNRIPDSSLEDSNMLGW